MQIQGIYLGIAIGQYENEKGKPVGVRVTKIYQDTAEAVVMQKLQLGMKLVQVQGQPVGHMATVREVVAVIKAVVVRPLELVFEPLAPGAAATTHSTPPKAASPFGQPAAGGRMAMRNPLAPAAPGPSSRSATAEMASQLHRRIQVSASPARSRATYVFPMARQSSRL